MIRQTWENLSPRNKRIAIIAGGAGVLLLFVALFSGDNSSSGKKRPDENIRHILTDRNTREVGIDGLSADLKLMSRDNANLRKELEKISAELGKGTAEQAERLQTSRDVAALQDQLQKLTEKLEKNAEDAAKAAEESKGEAETDVENNGSEGTVSAAGSYSAALSDAMSQNNPEDFFRNAPVVVKDSEGGKGEAAQSKGLVIGSFSAAAPDEEAPVEEKAEQLYMPAGSIISGVLISGMDAPTSNGARQDPFPATLRIQKEAILPNRYRADVRECFLIVSGYGDLSSERAYLRGETLSCIKENGDVLEARLDSYAVGEDGKAGVRGRLVSKQGQIIARSLMAGFMAGAAEAFDVKRVPRLSLDAGRGRSQYERNDFSSTLMQGSAARGASTALDRIAEFYIDMAEGIFPVIEIDAGRQIEIIISKGSSLQVRGSKGK